MRSCHEAEARGWITLGSCALLSLALYWARWTRSFPLADLYAVPHVDVGRLTRYAPAEAAIWLVTLAGLFALYALAARAVTRLGDDRRALYAVLGAALGFGLALAATFPLTALDIYGYLFQGRIIAHYQANPYLLPPTSFAGDPWLPLLAWPGETANYGPLWLWLSALGALVAGSDLLRGLLFFKIGGLLALLVCSITVYKLLLPRGRGDALAGALLVAWNPLVLSETANNGHNDIAMALLALAALLAQQRAQAWRAYALLAASALIKFISGLLLPALVAHTARAYGGRGWRLAPVREGLLVAGVIVILAYWPLWAGPQALGFLQRGDLFTASPGALAYHLLGGKTSPWAGTVVKLAGGGLLVAFTLWRCWRVGPDPRQLVAASCDLLLAYLALATFWFQPWYVVVMVPFAVAAGGIRRRVGLVWSASALANYFLFNYLWLWFPDWFDEVRLQATAVALIFGPPATALTLALWQHPRTVARRA